MEVKTVQSNAALRQSLSNYSNFLLLYMIQSDNITYINFAKYDIIVCIRYSSILYKYQR